MRVSMLLLVAPLLGLPGAFAEAAAASRLPKPSFEEQNKAEKAIRKLFKEDYAKRTLEGRQALAAKLLASARGTKDDPAGFYVLLSEACEIAESSGDVKTALAAVTLISERFDVDAAKRKREVLDRMRRTVRTPEAARALIDGYFAAADEAKAGEDYDGALSLLKKAESAARSIRSNQQADVKLAIDDLLEAKELRQELDRLKTALKDDTTDQSVKQLVDLLIIRMDDPLQATQYAFMLADEQTQKMIFLASAAAEQRTAEEALALGRWYCAMAEEARKADKLFLLERALTHHQDFLKKDKSEGLKRKAAEQMVAKLEEDVDKLYFGNVGDVTRGLLARWGFDDPGRPGYETRRKFHATPSGPGAGWARDPQRGGVMSFDGSGAHLKLPANPQTGHTAGSWAFWIKLPAPPPAAGYGCQVYVQETSVWIAMSHGGVGMDLNSGRGWFDTRGGAALGAIAGKGKITPNQWHHIAFSWDGKVVRCYHNGVLTSEAPTVGPKAKAQVAKLGPGTNRAMGSRLTSASTYLEGRIDEFRIYNRALSDKEVMAIVRATHPGRSK